MHKARFHYRLSQHTDLFSAHFRNQTSTSLGLCTGKWTVVARQWLWLTNPDWLLLSRKLYQQTSKNNWTKIFRGEAIYNRAKRNAAKIPASSTVVLLGFSAVVGAFWRWSVTLLTAKWLRYADFLANSRANFVWRNNRWEDETSRFILSPCTFPEMTSNSSSENRPIVCKNFIKSHLLLCYRFSVIQDTTMVRV